MLNLQQIEQDLIAAMKAKDEIAVETLRGLKTAVQNLQIAKMHEVSPHDLQAIVQREVKKRKEAAAAFIAGKRPELADRELKQEAVLRQYLPQQLSAEELVILIDRVLAAGSFTAKDFGLVMNKLKAEAGASADGAELARLLKEKLK